MKNTKVNKNQKTKKQSYLTERFKYLQKYLHKKYGLVLELK